MDWHEAPKADAAMLAYLASVTAVLGLFAWFFYALIQPTVLPNAGLAQYKEPGRAAVLLQRIDTSFERMETAAIAAAKQANQEQGIDPLRAYASARPDVAASNSVATRSPELTAKQPKQAKPKRVVRRAPVADHERREFAFGSNGWFGPTSGRPMWPARGQFWGHY